MTRAVAAVLGIALTASPAFADDRPAGPAVNAQSFRLDPIGTGLPGLAGTALLPRHGLHLGLGLVHAVSPLEASTETEGALVRRITTLDVGIGYGLGVLDLFLTLPMHLDVEAGAEDVLDRPYIHGFGGLGDIRFGAVGRILDAEELTFGLAVRVEATVPTGDASGSLGWAGPTLRPAVLTEFRAWVIRFLTETSLHLRPRADALGVVAHHALGLTLGLAVTPTAPTELRALEIAVLLDARPELPDTPGEELPASRSPVEWRVALVARPTPCVALQAGAGTGIGSGWGTPKARVFVALDVTVDASGRGCGDRSAL